MNARGDNVMLKQPIDPDPSSEAMSKAAGNGNAMCFRLGLVCVMALFVSGCGNSNLLEPIGIGSDRDALKRSPCACYELPQNYRGWTLS